MNGELDSILILIGVVSLGLYCLLISLICLGWLKEKVVAYDGQGLSTFVSIVIAARNEDKTITSCLDCLVQQTYPIDKYEIIVVDDCSTDNTNNVIRNFISLSKAQIQLISLDENQVHPGKKTAILKGIESATGELIITTDADVQMRRRWLKAIVAHYEHKRPKMILSPVITQTGKSFFSSMQTLESAGLALATAGSALLHRPLMANGANLAYQKSAFFEVNGFMQIDHIASGDDVLLMHKFKKRFPGRISFLKSWDAIVYAEAAKTIRDLLQQRLRWSSKYTCYKDTDTLLAGVIVMLAGTSLLINAVFALFIDGLVEFFLLQLLLKATFDFLFLLLAVSFFRKRKLMLVFLPTLLLEYIYSVAVVVWSILARKYEWKGREIK